MQFELSQSSMSSRREHAAPMKASFIFHYSTCQWISSRKRSQFYRQFEVGEVDSSKDRMSTVALLLWKSVWCELKGWVSSMHDF